MIGLNEANADILRREKANAAMQRVRMIPGTTVMKPLCFNVSASDVGVHRRTRFASDIVANSSGCEVDRKKWRMKK